MVHPLLFYASNEEKTLSAVALLNAAQLALFSLFRVYDTYSLQDIPIPAMINTMPII